MNHEVFYPGLSSSEKTLPKKDSAFMVLIWGGSHC